jgi:hypothetical protein
LSILASEVLAQGGRLTIVRPGYASDIRETRTAAAALTVKLPNRSLIAAASSLGVRTKRGQ